MSDYVTLSSDQLFFSNVYNYYARGGYWCIFVENILNIVLTAFTLVFVTFVCFFLNWDAIGKCESEETCKDMASYIISPTNFHPTGVNVCMFLFIIMFFIYWLWISATMIRDIFIFVKYKRFFSDTLGIAIDELKVLEWSDVAKKIIDNDTTLTAEIIVGSIMKKDNYLISIVGSNVFRIKSYYYTHSFLWLINIGLLNQIFLYGSTSKRYIADYGRIKRVMKILGILQIIFLPFTLSILLIHYIVSFTTDIYTKKSYIGPKEWTIYAKLLFREYNELPHIFNDRIEKSYKHAGKYEQKFNSHMMNIVMDKIIFILGTYLTLLVIMTLYDERIVMYMRLFNRNLLWYVAIITSLISLAKLMMVYPSTINYARNSKTYALFSETMGEYSNA
jgi:autophagy-related protein 9